MTGPYWWINMAEAVLWIGLGILVLLASAVRRRLGVWASVLAGTLLAFGASDVVETRTGAWWDPWWLLLWKAACVAILLGLLLEWVRRR